MLDWLAAEAINSHDHTVDTSPPLMLQRNVCNPLVIGSLGWIEKRDCEYRWVVTVDCDDTWKFVSKQKKLMNGNAFDSLDQLLSFSAFSRMNEHGCQQFLLDTKDFDTLPKKDNIPVYWKFLATTSPAANRTMAKKSSLLG